MSSLLALGCQNTPAHSALLLLLEGVPLRPSGSGFLSLGFYNAAIKQRQFLGALPMNNGDVHQLF